MVQIVEKILTLLKRQELSECLSVLGRHNKSQARRDNAPFLLGPHLFQLFNAAESRRFMRTKMPVLGLPPAEVREHLQEVSTKSKALARLLRRGPQPHVALVLPDDLSNAFTLPAPLPTIRAPKEAVTIETLDLVLDRVAEAFDRKAKQISGAKHHNRPAKEASKAAALRLRSYAAGVLVRRFREKLGHPYHSHVATIAELLSNIPTDTDYVKKVEARAGAGKGQNP